MQENYIFTIIPAPFSKCVPSGKAGVLKFLRFEQRFPKLRVRERLAGVTVEI